jgi:LruC domain-containing protein
MALLLISFSESNCITMKKLILPAVVVLLVIASCKKPENNTNDTDKSISDLIIADNFDWNTTKTVKFFITTDQASVITIKSIDNNTVYHKGFYNQIEESYDLSINMPASIEEVMVNNKIVTLSGNNTYVDLTTSTKSYQQVNEFPTEGLVALWHLDENDGATAEDSEGVYDGTISGFNWTPGISGSSINLNGEDGGVMIPSHPGLNLTGDELSLSIWFKMEETGQDGTLMFHNTKYILRIDKHGKINFAIYNPTYKSVTIPWSKRIIDTDWHNISAVYNGEEMFLYVDNELMASKETSGNLNSRQTNVYLGYQSSSKYFAGIIDEAVLYSRALTIQDIETIYNTIPNPDGGGSSLVSYWPLDEFGGVDVPDAQGDNAGTNYGGTWTTGVKGNCLDFNGSSEYVNIPKDETLNFTNSLTIMAWAKTRDYKEAKIAQKGDWDGHGIGGSKWNGWKGHVRISGGGTEAIEWTDGRPLLNEWYHIAITYDGSKLKMYINGQLNNSRDVSGTLNINNRTASIGSDNGAQKFFNGLIDEVKFFNTALTATQIQSEYGDQTAGTDTDGDGVQDEEDNYPNDPARAFLNHFPSEGFGSIGFEDLWPGTGDYDFNDLVIDYRFEIVTNASNKVSDLRPIIVIKAIGASLDNGFGFVLENETLDQSSMTVSDYKVEEGYVTLGDNGLEEGQSKPTIIVFDNVNRIMPSPTGFGVNVESDKPFVDPDTTIINIAFDNSNYTLSDLNLDDFNPFIIVDGERGKEIHLSDYPPTDLVDDSYFGQESDDSDAALGRYYKTSSNLPWAINIATSFDYPIEKVEITSAYNYFADWAESSGTLYQDWYGTTSGYRNNSNIYQHPSK